MNTKSWVKITQHANDERELAVDAHFNLIKLPLLWDFGVEKPPALWQHEQPGPSRFRSSIATPPGISSLLPTLCSPPLNLRQLGHLAGCGASRGVWGLEGCQSHRSKTHRRWPHPHRRDLTVYFHVVGQPIPVTAVTSPQAMISPLVVSTQKN